MGTTNPQMFRSSVQDYPLKHDRNTSQRVRQNERKSGWIEHQHQLASIWIQGKAWKRRIKRICSFDKD